MLRRFCLPQAHKESAPTLVSSSLKNHILQDCATLCVENARKIITLMYDNHQPDIAIEILPWWYRVFYTYVASQHLIAAMLRPDVFASVVTESWSKATTIFSALEHLSPSVQRCVANFQTMWQKVNGIHSSYSLGAGQVSPPEGPSDSCYQDVFQHLGFDEFPVSGLENVAWLGNNDWNLPMNF